MYLCSACARGAKESMRLLIVCAQTPPHHFRNGQSLLAYTSRCARGRTGPPLSHRRRHRPLTSPMAPASSALAYAVAALVCAGAGAYQQPLARPSASPRAALARQPALLPSMAASALEQSDASAAALEPVKPRTNALKTALIGSTFWLAAGLVLTVLFPLACLCWVHGKLFDKKRFRFNDYIVQIWARITMTLFRAEVTVENAELLPPADEAVMYTPNHLA